MSNFYPYPYFRFFDAFLPASVVPLCGSWYRKASNYQLRPASIWHSLLRHPRTVRNRRWIYTRRV